MEVFGAISKTKEGFPGGAVVGSPPADAGDAGSCPGPGESHMPRSGWAREPWPLSLRVRSLCSETGEAATVRGPHTTKKKKKKISETSYFDVLRPKLQDVGLFLLLFNWLS